MRKPALLLTFCLVLGAVAQACIHGPEGYEGKLKQERQQALAVFHDGQQDLFLRPTVTFDRQAPAEIAWVIPVPSVPSHYAEAKSGGMQALIKQYDKVVGPTLARGTLEFESDSDGVDTLSRSAPIEVLELKTAGDYSIQPIKAHGEAGATALAGWLKDNGFGTVPAANMAYYVEQGWVWLCVKAKPTGQRNELAPLQLSFATPRIVYPLKFSTHQGDFTLDLFVVTEVACPELDKELEPFGLQSNSTRFALPKATQACLNGAKLEGQVTVTHISGPLTGKQIAGWATDLSLTPRR